MEETGRKLTASCWETQVLVLTMAAHKVSGNRWQAEWTVAQALPKQS